MCSRTTIFNFLNWIRIYFIYFMVSNGVISKCVRKLLEYIVQKLVNVIKTKTQTNMCSRTTIFNFLNWIRIYFIYFMVSNGVISKCVRKLLEYIVQKLVNVIKTKTQTNMCSRTTIFNFLNWIRIYFIYFMVSNGVISKCVRKLLEYIVQKLVNVIKTKTQINMCSRTTIFNFLNWIRIYFIYFMVSNGVISKCVRKLLEYIVQKLVNVIKTKTQINMCSRTTIFNFLNWIRIYFIYFMVSNGVISKCVRKLLEYIVQKLVNVIKTKTQINMCSRTTIFNFLNWIRIYFIYFMVSNGVISKCVRKLLEYIVQKLVNVIKTKTQINMCSRTTIFNFLNWIRIYFIYFMVSNGVISKCVRKLLEYIVQKLVNVIKTKTQINMCSRTTIFNFLNCIKIYFIYFMVSNGVISKCVRKLLEYIVQKQHVLENDNI